jgi:uncharacterized membrane protein
MRIVIVVVGIVLIILGAVLAFVPLTTAATQEVTSSAPYGANITAAFSITGTVPLTISWTSGSSTTVLLGACDKISSSANCTNPQLTTQSGTSGSWNVNVKPGGAIVAACATSGCTANVTVKEGQTVIGDILLILGIVILIVGVILKSKPKMAPPMAQPMPPDNTMGGQPPMGSQ